MALMEEAGSSGTEEVPGCVRALEGLTGGGIVVDEAQLLNSNSNSNLPRRTAHSFQRLLSLLRAGVDHDAHSYPESAAA